MLRMVCARKKGRYVDATGGGCTGNVPMTGMFAAVYVGQKRTAVTEGYNGGSVAISNHNQLRGKM